MYTANSSGDMNQSLVIRFNQKETAALNQSLSDPMEPKAPFFTTCNGMKFRCEQEAVKHLYCSLSEPDKPHIMEGTGKALELFSSRADTTDKPNYIVQLLPDGQLADYQCAVKLQKDDTAILPPCIKTNHEYDNIPVTCAYIGLEENTDVEAKECGASMTLSKLPDHWRSREHDDRDLIFKGSVQAVLDDIPALAAASARIEFNNCHAMFAKLKQHGIEKQRLLKLLDCYSEQLKFRQAQTEQVMQNINNSYINLNSTMIKAIEYALKNELKTSDDMSDAGLLELVNDHAKTLYIEKMPETSKIFPVEHNGESCTWKYNDDRCKCGDTKIYCLDIYGDFINGFQCSVGHNF